MRRAYHFVTEHETLMFRVLSLPYNQGTYCHWAGMAQRLLTVWPVPYYNSAPIWTAHVSSVDPVPGPARPNDCIAWHWESARDLILCFPPVSICVWPYLFLRGQCWWQFSAVVCRYCFSDTTSLCCQALVFSLHILPLSSWQLSFSLAMSWEKLQSKHGLLIPFCNPVKSGRISAFNDMSNEESGR